MIVVSIHGYHVFYLFDGLMCVYYMMHAISGHEDVHRLLGLFLRVAYH